jgi:hypothetical protein
MSFRDLAVLRSFGHTNRMRAASPSSPPPMRWSSLIILTAEGGRRHRSRSIVADAKLRPAVGRRHRAVRDAAAVDPLLHGASYRRPRTVALGSLCRAYHSLPLGGRRGWLALDWRHFTQIALTCGDI